MCVVGHGPSLQGAGKGEAIDAHDIIIRMAYCGWQNAADYGVTYHVGVVSNAKLARVDKHQPKPDEYWYFRKQQPRGKRRHVCPDVLNKRPVREFDMLAWHKRLRDMGAVSRNGNPAGISLGTSAVITAMEQYGPKYVAVAGFDWAMGHEAPAHPEGYPYISAAHRTSNAWDAERRLYDHIRTLGEVREV